MKRVVIGAFTALLGSIWTLAIVFLAGNNLVSGWSTPPGRFLTTVAELDLLAVFALAVVFTVLGIVIMAVEYFRKEP